MENIIIQKRKHWSAFIGIDPFHTRLSKVVENIPKQYTSLLVHKYPSFNNKKDLEACRNLVNHGYPKREDLLQALETIFL